MKTSIKHDIFCVADDLIVRVQIFSGRNDPEWSLPSTDPNHGKIMALLKKARSTGFAYSQDATPGRLGYKGTLVREGTTEQLFVGPETKDLQSLLLSTISKDLLKVDNIKEIEEEITKGAVKPEFGEQLGADAHQARSKRVAPQYTPNLWNLNGHIRKCNNCYNYACNMRTNTFSQPGEGSNQIYTMLTGANVRAAAVRDGMVVLLPVPAPTAPPPTSPPGPEHIVALAIDAGW